jgi:hypothetical protein
VPAAGGAKRRVKVAVRKPTGSSGTEAAVSDTFRGWRRFKQENPEFDFKTFYKELDEYFKDQGGARGVLSRHGRDYKFGSEHFRAWQMLQKAKSEEGILLETAYKRWSMITS